MLSTTNNTPSDRNAFDVAEFLKSIAGLEPLERRDRIQEQLDALNKDLDSINHQLGLARARLFSEGRYADPNWYTRINYVKRTKGRQVQGLQQALGALPRRKAGNEGPRTTDLFSSYFLKAAKALLTGQQYTEIIEAAKRTQQAEATGEKNADD